MKIWCIMTFAVTLIAKKREVAITMNYQMFVRGWVFRGANVKRFKYSQYLIGKPDGKVTVRTIFSVREQINVCIGTAKKNGKMPCAMVLSFRMAFLYEPARHTRMSVQSPLVVLTLLFSTKRRRLFLWQVNRQ